MVNVLRRGLQGEPGLADPARAGERQQSRGPQVPPEISQYLPSSHEAGRSRGRVPLANIRHRLAAPLHIWQEQQLKQIFITVGARRRLWITSGRNLGQKVVFSVFDILNRYGPQAPSPERIDFATAGSPDLSGVDLIGFPMGGTTARTIAVEHPDPVRSLTSMMSRSANQA
ncbi:hypothetical protein [Streptomyces sp. N50]|uniref:hypothetical protein n=1 Tax=Streptomyces sp. N50 TaxID=3081765 RepID=UPI0029625B9A|nr:hypothetical protein [Streptomyces sp. N50]WOX15963.1 hypothetical protein R2B38_00700 [Streptomyces sp. N50]